MSSTAYAYFICARLCTYRCAHHCESLSTNVAFPIVNAAGSFLIPAGTGTKHVPCAA